jgi:L,D-transpeptidase catalytic domain/Sporulation and spore germination/Putative peptidoglycan binding domain
MRACLACAVGALALALGYTLQPRASATTSARTVDVVFLRGEQLAGVQRPGRTPKDAVARLIQGLTRAEIARSFRTYVPSSTRVHELKVHKGLATIDLNPRFLAGQPDDRVLASLSQLVGTLSAFRRIDRVQLLVAGKRVKRTIAGVRLNRPITLRYLQTPNVPVPEPPEPRIRPPDPEVKKAQQQLITLDYLLPGDDDGVLGPTTSEGLLAFQKFQRMPRSGLLDAATKQTLATAAHPEPVTQGAAGKRAEVLLDRQVTLLIQDNEVVRTIAVSSGKPSTPTPPGRYRVYAKIPRWWSTPFREWLPWAIPFFGGYAFHEYGNVPAYPASHGCVRQPFAVARWTYAFAEVGMPVRVLAGS